MSCKAGENLPEVAGVKICFRFGRGSNASISCLLFFLMYRYLKGVRYLKSSAARSAPCFIKALKNSE